MNIDEIKERIKKEIAYCDTSLDCGNEAHRSYYEGKSIGLGYALHLIENFK